MSTDRWAHLRSPLADHYRAASLWRGVLVDSYLDDGAARSPSAVAVVDGDRELGYGPLRAAVVAATAALRRLGVAAGDVVSWILPNWSEALVVHHATIRLGAVSNPIVPIYRHREVGFILREARSKVLVVPATFRGFDYPGMIAQLRPDLPDLEHVVTARGSGADHALDDLLAADPGSEGDPEHGRGPDDPVLLLYTSGTTADPKGAVHSHNTLDHELRSIVALFAVTSADVVFMPSPLTHVTGVLYGVHLPLLIASKVVLQDVWEPTRALELLERHRASFTVAATPFLHALAHHPELDGRDLALRLFACGGADVPPQLIRTATDRLGCCVVRVYGSTEYPTVTSGGFADTLDRQAETDGRPIGAAEVRIVDDEGVRLEPGGVGELVVRGPEQFLGYLDPAASAAALTPDGWFRTGDLGSLDLDGYLSISGRKKDIIIRGGENLSVKQIEDLLVEHPLVAEVAVVGMPDPVLVERVCAYIVPIAGDTPTLAGLTAHLRACGMAAQKFPERLEVVDSLPKTASGKVQKFVLRDRIRQAIEKEIQPVTG